jgi:TatD DNase family protein
MLGGSTYAFVPARGGSKGIPHKNVRTVGGVPLVVRAVVAARAALTVDRVLVSTDDDTIATLARDAQGLDVILHCFSMPDRLGECLEHGWWISFAGNVTYPKARELAYAAEQAPLDRILVETDAPYLTPQAVRKHRNQPAFVVHTARFVAERKGVPYEELEAAVHANSARLFGW